MFASFPRDQRDPAKLIEIDKANSTATLDFAQELLGVKSPAAAIELWTGHTKKQFENFPDQAKELAEIDQRVASATAEPIKATASKIYTPPPDQRRFSIRKPGRGPGFLLFHDPPRLLSVWQRGGGHLATAFMSLPGRRL